MSPLDNMLQPHPINMMIVEDSAPLSRWRGAEETSIGEVMMGEVENVNE